MKLGVMSFNTEYTMRADKLACALEERGFESLWLPEHTHIPVPAGVAGDSDPENGMPRMPDGNFLPEEYRHMSDPFTSLAAAAAVTKKLILGTCICLINQHHPINLAKTASTLDQLSDGRLILGVGAGWNVAEMGNHGVVFKRRWRELRERVKALQAIWNYESTSFVGEFVNFDEMWQYPKPIQPGGPPIVLGTLDTPFGRKQVAEHGDGWLPLTFDLERTIAGIQDIKTQMSQLGRDSDQLDVSLFFLADSRQTQATLDRAAEVGANRIILRLPVADEREVLNTLDYYAELNAKAGK